VKAIDGRIEQRLNNGLLTGHAYAISNVRKVLHFINNNNNNNNNNRLY